MGIPGDHQHQGGCHQQAGDEAGGEKLADGGRGHDAVDDHGQRWRDDRTDGRGRGSNPDREIRVVAGVTHGLDLDGAKPPGVGDGGAGHAGEDDRGSDVHMAQATVHPANAGSGEGENPIGDADRVHQ